jgi:hypothetical protein
VSVAVWISAIVLGRSMGYEQRGAPQMDAETQRLLESSLPSR